MMNFLTDFADQAVVLPLIATVAIALGVLGWRRGAVAWLAAVGLSFGAVFLLKLALFACGPALGVPALRSPSGHAAAAAVVAGGLAVILGWRWPRVLALASLGAAAIGATRVALGLHSVPEVIVGGTLGLGGALGFAMLAGTRPALRLRWLFAAIGVAALLLHGQHLNAEARIRSVAFDLPVCRGDQLRP